MLNDRKITDWAQPVSSLDDRPQMTAAALKAAFDSNTNQIKPAVNGMIDDLTGTGGAGNIGVDVIAGVTGTTVQAMLAALKALIDLCDTSAESDDKLNLKADKTTTDKLVKTITLNADTGVFTIQTDDGTTTTIDTMLEKIPVNCYLDGQDFVLVLDDGTEQRADLSGFLTPTEFTDSSTIDFSVSGSAVTATIKNGSITLAMLESTVMSTIQGYVTAAQTAAGNASTSETNAGTYRDQAQTAATNSASSASKAGTKAMLSQSWAIGGTGTRQGEDTNNSKYFAQQSANSAATAQGWSDSAMEQADAAAQSAADAAQSAADAEAISGGDFIPNSRKGVPNGVATLDSNGKLVMAQLPDDTEAVPVTLTATGWSSAAPYTQTVDANGVLADEDAQMIIPVPEDDSSDAYYRAGVRCTAQAANSLTFTCDAKPNEDIALYVMVSSVGNTAGGGGTSGPVLPTPTTGDAGKVPTVNDAEDGYELKTPSGGGGTGGISDAVNGTDDSGLEFKLTFGRNTTQDLTATIEYDEQDLTLDSIVQNGKSYRDLFETPNVIPDGDFESDLSWATINAGDPQITAEAYSSPSHSLKCFGTTSQQIRKVLGLSASESYYIAARVRLDRYVSGAGIGLQCPDLNNIVTNQLTNGQFATVSSVETLGQGSQMYAGSISSANLDGYVDDIVIVPVSNFKSTDKSEIDVLYENYIKIKRGESVTPPPETLVLETQKTKKSYTATECIAKFMEAVTSKAADLGMANSTFTRPAGDGGNTTTARDLMRMVVEASGYKDIARIWGKNSRDISVMGPNPRTVNVSTTVIDSELEASYHIFGGKTGSWSGTENLVVAAQTTKHGMVAGVIMDATSSAARFDAMKELLDVVDGTGSTVSSATAAIACAIPEYNVFNYEGYVFDALYELNADEEIIPASTTKVITAMVALDYVTDIHNTIEFISSDAIGGSGAVFQTGDIITIEDALYAMLLPSSNMTAQALARTVGYNMLVKEESA